MENKNALKVGDKVYDGIYFTKHDLGVVKHIREDGWCLVKYEVSAGVGIVIPPEKLNKICTHPNTYVAVRHVSGLKLIKCSDCNCII